jgi:hypothetical protein
MPTLFRRNEKSEIDEAEIRAFRHRVGCARCLAKSNWLVALSERPLQILAEERASSGAIVFDIWTEESTGRTNCIFWE